MFLRHKRSFLRGFVANLLLVVIILSSTLAGATSVAEAASKPEISKKSRTILVGNKYNLNINNKVKGSTYKWESSNEDVATVDSRGFVTGISKGKANITCTIKGPKETYKVSCTVTIRKPAEDFEINNKVSILNVGQKYNLNRDLYPASSNDLTSWTTSDESIAIPDARGKFTALEEGTVTITGTTLSKKSDQVTIKVVDEAGTVTTQEELDEYLGSGVGLITVKTDDEVELSIPEGSYKKQNLVVDAPKAEITNNGVFKSIKIMSIKPNTWYEQAIGNVLNVSAQNSRVVVDNNAEATIVSSGPNLNIVNNGVINGLTLDSSGIVNIEGAQTTPIPVTANVANASLRTSVPVNMTCNQRVVLTILPGAESSTVTVASEDLIPIIRGTGTINVVIGSGENAVTRTIAATPIDSTSGASGSYLPDPGPSPDPGPGPVVGTSKISGRVTSLSAASGSAIGVDDNATGASGSAVTSGSAISVVPGASVRILKYDGIGVNAALEAIFTNPNTIITVTDENGLYSATDLEEGNYVAVMAKAGYKVLIQQTSVSDGGSTILNGVLIPLSDDETITNGYVSGKIIDALNGEQVDSSLEFTLNVYSRNEGSSGDLVLSKTVTGAEYSLELAEGYYIVEIKDNRTAVDGVTYATATKGIIILGGTSFENEDMVLSTLKTEGQATFVLTWGEYPKDLDSHLIGPAGEYENYHICYYSMGYPEEVDHDDLENLDLRLDWDDVTSYGPETVTIYKPVQDGVYTYYVYNYSGKYNYSGNMYETLANSGAKVVVTTATESRTFEVPTGGDELSWVVCTFDSATGRITPINQLIEGDYCDTVEDLVDGYSW